MLQTEVFNQNIEAYEAWYRQYPEVFESELLAINEQLQKLPENISGIEVGLGTGRFAFPLGIKEGIEPAENMAAIAQQKGIEVMPGIAEKMPYKDLHFDFVLFVTICHLDNPLAAFKEANRVLKHQGNILLGFIPQDSTIGKAYEARRQKSAFYKYATFYKTNKIAEWLKLAGFKHLEYVQTLFGELESIKEVQVPESGYDRGSFVVIKATKKKR